MAGERVAGSRLDLLMARSSTAKFGTVAPTPAELDLILAAAARAPDHGRLAPWRFFVFEGEARRKLGELYVECRRIRGQAADPEAERAELDKAFRAPTVVVVAASVRPHPKVPILEQTFAVAAAVQNMLLAAEALGLGAVWKTGKIAYLPAMKELLGLQAVDQVVGLVYLGDVARRLPPRTDTAEAHTTRMAC